eukprot:TRINITY_DN1092_c0_g1_i1.p1 TRINITY_DN1092_c0_g1~~TRINITY_DN1092_c0_g1_i1.p1  ORF type:complete len:512 (+),score=56.68 TRINITY_DN1092_c0_g1_i1:2789-4324(+)
MSSAGIPYLPDRETDLFNTYRILHTAESKHFIVEISEESSGSSFMNCRVVGLKHYTLDSGSEANDLPLEYSMRRPLLFGSHFIWPVPTDDGEPEDSSQLVYGNIIDDTVTSLSLSDADRRSRFYFNKHSAFPWLMIYRHHESSGSSSNESEPFSASVSIYDLTSGRVIVKNAPIPLTDEDTYITSVTFFSEYIFIEYMADDGEYTLCLKVDPTAAALQKLWIKQGSAGVCSVTNSIGTVYLNRRYMIMSLDDGVPLIEGPVGQLRSQPTGYGRFYVEDDAIWDVFDPSGPLMKLSYYTKVSFLDPTHWLFMMGSACYRLDFETPYKSVESFVTCCALGKIDFPESDLLAPPVRVRCKPELIDLNTSQLLDQVCSLLGCSRDRLGYQKYGGYSLRLHVFFDSHTQTADAKDEPAVSLIARAVPSSETDRRPCLSIQSRYCDFSAGLLPSKPVLITWDHQDRKLAPKSLQNVVGERFEYVVLSYDTVIAPVTLSDVRHFRQDWVSDRAAAGKK